MKNFLTIAFFALFVSLFYTAIGHMLPQLPSYPPAEVKLGDAMTSEDLVAAGAGVFEANCNQCHKLGHDDRCPDLSRIGSQAIDFARLRASETSKAYDDADFIIESVCQPGAHLH